MKLTETKPTENKSDLDETNWKNGPKNKIDKKLTKNWQKVTDNKITENIGCIKNWKIGHGLESHQILFVSSMITQYKSNLMEK